MRIPDTKGLISIANARLETSKRTQPATAEIKPGPTDKVELSIQAQQSGKLLEGGRESARAQEQARLAALEQARQELGSGGQVRPGHRPPMS
jgi:hypothetical protein